jgi:hypothetical protein
MELVSKLSKDAKERKAKQVKKRSGTRQILRREIRYLMKCLKESLKTRFRIWIEKIGKVERSLATNDALYCTRNTREGNTS